MDEVKMSDEEFVRLATIARYNLKLRIQALDSIIKLYSSPITQEANAGLTPVNHEIRNFKKRTMSGHAIGVSVLADRGRFMKTAEIQDAAQKKFPGCNLLKIAMGMNYAIKNGASTQAVKIVYQGRIHWGLKNWLDEDLNPRPEHLPNLFPNE